MNDQPALFIVYASELASCFWFTKSLNHSNG